jgi:molybdopterin-guanine dinucleotide biosynthesis protein A
MTAPINGLLLAGGKSRRMGRDKADLAVHGDESLRDRGLRLLGEVTGNAFLSIATDDDRDYAIPTLRDAIPDKGPLGGILTALESNPGSAWLVVACDLPNLNAETLARLVAARDPSAEATAFLSDIDGVPEALCAIYEPAAIDKLRATIETNKLCARHFLASLRHHAIPLVSPGALQNCNRPEDLEELRLQAATGPSEKSITLEFFAKLRDEAGCTTKPHTTRAATAAGLWDEVRLLHKLSMDLNTVRLAVNDEFADWSHPLADQDRIAFMPPFAGG